MHHQHSCSSYHAMEMAAKFTIGFLFTTCLASAVVQGRSVTVRQAVTDSNSNSTSSITTWNSSNPIQNIVGEGLSAAKQIADSVQSGVDAAEEASNNIFNLGTNIAKTGLSVASNATLIVPDFFNPFSWLG